MKEIQLPCQEVVDHIWWNEHTYSYPYYWTWRWSTQAKNQSLTEWISFDKTYPMQRLERALITQNH